MALLKEGEKLSTSPLWSDRQRVAVARLEDELAHTDGMIALMEHLLASDDLATQLEISQMVSDACMNRLPGDQRSSIALHLIVPMDLPKA
jgi:hypothetical protein